MKQKFKMGDRVIRTVWFPCDTKNVGKIMQIYYRQSKVWYLVKWTNEDKEKLTELHCCMEENEFHYGRDFASKIKDRMK